MMMADAFKDICLVKKLTPGTSSISDDRNDGEEGSLHPCFRGCIMIVA
jgi:hypothetical protein